MLQDSLISVGLLYVVLGLATYYDYRWPVQIFGHYLPRSYWFWQWFLVGPAIVFFVGIWFGFIGAVLLSPIIFFALGKIGLAIACVVGLGILTQYTSLFTLNGIVYKFDFPINVVTGFVQFLVFGLIYLLVGAVLLSPILVYFIL